MNSFVLSMIYILNDRYANINPLLKLKIGRGEKTQKLNICDTIFVSNKLQSEYNFTFQPEINRNE